MLRLLPELTIVNLIATTELGQFVDLEKLSAVGGFLYDKAIYHCAYLKDQRTHAKVSIFATGKMISVGTKSLKTAKDDLQYAAKRLAELRLISPIRIKATLRNLVATAKLGHEIDIESLAMKLPHVIYEPEQFPAAICYSEELEGASILVFTSGKVVLAGLKREDLLETGRKVLAKLADEIFRLSAPRVPLSKALSAK